MTTVSTTSFTPTQQTQLEALRANLARRIKCPVTLDYGADDHGCLWAALCVEDQPDGAFGRPGMLVSILTGTGIDGEAAIMAADGGTIDLNVSMHEATKAALFAGVREYRERSQGAFRPH